MAIASGIRHRLMGEFHGEMMPTTPSGWSTIRAVPVRNRMATRQDRGRIQCRRFRRRWSMP